MLDRLYENIMCSFNLACNIRTAKEYFERINIPTIYSSSYIKYMVIMDIVGITLIEYIRDDTIAKRHTPIIRRPVAMFSATKFKSYLGEEGINFLIRGGNIDECYSVSIDEFCMSSVNQIDRNRVKKMLSRFEFNRETLILLNETIEKLNLEIV